MEMPTDRNSGDYLYFAHDKLPSNSNLRNYSFCLDKTNYCALWVAYPLHDCYNGSSDRTDAFGYDPYVASQYQADIGSNAYYPQGGAAFSHSRGHQLPSADRTASAADNRTTFYATNMTPQLQALNGGQWVALENNVRKWMCSDTLYVVTGAHFDPSRAPKYVYDSKGEGKACRIPSHYYKVVIRSKTGNTGKSLRSLDASDLQCIGFWFDHEDSGSWSLSQAIRSVADIEVLTGFSFFANVPNAPKNQQQTNLWVGL